MLVPIVATTGISFEKDFFDFRMFAIRRHANQKYCDMPYAYHLAMVEAILMENGFSGYNYQAAAWLHDIVEDTDVELSHLQSLYGASITSIVWACTGEGENRKARNESVYQKLEKHPMAAPVKVADRLANMLVSSGRSPISSEPSPQLKMYMKEWEAFKTRVSPLMEDTHNKRLLWDTLATLAHDLQEPTEVKKETDESTDK